MSQAIHINEEFDFQQLVTSLDKVVTATQLVNKIESVIPIETCDYQFYEIKSLTHYSNEPQRQALENIYSSLRYSGISIVYLLKGNSSGVKFYIGIVRNKQKNNHALELSVRHIADAILNPCFCGNFRGSQFEKIDHQIHSIEDLSNYNSVGLLQGVVGNQELGENNFFQGVDRLIDIMHGEDYCLVVNAAYVNMEALLCLENAIHSGYSKLALQAKLSVQHGTNNNKSEATGNNATYTEGVNRSQSECKTTGSSEGSSESKDRSTSRTTTKNDVSDAGSEGKSTYL